MNFQNNIKINEIQFSLDSLKYFSISMIFTDTWGTRHTWALLGFLASVLFYTMRVNISVAIVAMVKKDNVTTIDNTTESQVCPANDDADSDGDNLVSRY